MKTPNNAPSRSNRRRATRKSLMAFTQFAALAKRIRTEGGAPWIITKPGVMYLQRVVDACILAIMDVAIATQRSKTLTMRDVERAHQYFSVYTGTPSCDPKNPNTFTPQGIKFADKFALRALKRRHPGLIVQHKAAGALQRMYVGMTRMALGELVSQQKDATKKRVGPHDLCTYFASQPCLGLTPAPPPRAPRARRKRIAKKTTTPKVGASPIASI